MFCRFCGKRIEDDSIFCPFCGESTGLTTDEDAGSVEPSHFSEDRETISSLSMGTPSNTEAHSSDQEIKRANKKKIRTVILCVCSVLLLFGAYLAYQFLPGYIIGHGNLSTQNGVYEFHHLKWGMSEDQVNRLLFLESHYISPYDDMITQDIYGNLPHILGFPTYYYQLSFTDGKLSDAAFLFYPEQCTEQELIAAVTKRYGRPNRTIKNTWVGDKTAIYIGSNGDAVTLRYYSMEDLLG